MRHLRVATHAASPSASAELPEIAEYDTGEDSTGRQGLGFKLSHCGSGNTSFKSTLSRMSTGGHAGSVLYCYTSAISDMTG